MGLNFLRSEKEHKLSPEARKVLENYMAGAVNETKGTLKTIARHVARDEAKTFYHSEEAKGLTKADVQAMEKEVAGQLKQYGGLEKLNYHVNGLVNGADEKCQQKNPLPYLAIGLTTGIAEGLYTGLGGSAPGAIFSIGVAASLTKLAVVGISQMNPEKDAIEYTDLKHAQLALKKLKREFKKDERKEKRAEFKKEVSNLFAAGYGQPSGGLIQNPVQMAKLKKDLGR